MGKFGVGCRLGALVLLAGLGLFCRADSSGDDDDDDANPEVFTADMDLPDPTVDVPLDAGIRITCSSALERVQPTACVHVEESGIAASRMTTAAEIDPADSHRVLVSHAALFRPGTNYTVRLIYDEITVLEGEPVPPVSDWHEWTFTTGNPVTEPTPAFLDPATIADIAGSPWWIELAGDGSGNGIALIGSDELDSASSEMWDHVSAVPIAGCVAGAPVQLVFDAGVRWRGAIAMNTDGEAIATGPHQHIATGVHDIWIQHYDPITGWAAATSPPTPTHGEAVKSVHVDTDADGNGVVVYLAPPIGAGDTWHIEYTTYTESTDTWSFPVPLSSSVDLKEPVVAMSDDGDAIIVATEDVAGGGVVYHCPGVGGGQIPAATGYTASHARLAVNGSAFIVWTETNTAGTDTRIRAAYIAACGTPTVEYIDGGGSANLAMPDIVVDSSGAATAVWIDHQGGSDHDVVVNRYLPGSGWGTTPQVVMNSTYYLMDVRAAVSPGGQVSVLGRSGAVAEVSTLLPDGTSTPPEDVTTIEGAISLQMVDEARLLYMGSSQLVVGFVTVIGGIPDAAITLCD